MIAMKKWQMELNGQNMLCYAGDKRCAELSVKTDLPQSWHCQLGLRSKESVAFYPLEWEDGYLHAVLTEHELPCDGWYELQILGTRGAVQKSTEPFRVYICRADDGARQAAEQARRKAKEAGKQAEAAEKARRGAEQAAGHTSASATAAKHAALTAQQAQDAARSAQEQTAQHMQQAAESAARAEAYKTDALGYKKEAARSAQEAAAQVEKINDKDAYTRTEADVLLSEKADQPYQCAVGGQIELADSAGGVLRSITIKGNSTQKEVPSPDTPVAILHTDNPVALRTYGENRFCADFSIDCTKIDGSSCKILHTGTKTFAVAAIDVAQNVGQAYTLRIDFSKALPSPCTLLVQGMNAAGNRISFSTMEIGGQTTVIKNWAGVAGCTKIVGVSLWTNSAETFDLTAQYTLREGSTAEAYIPYCGNDYFIPVRDDAKETQFLGKIGSCADELQLDALGKGRLKKNCAQIALADATEASLLNKTDLFRTGGYNYAYVYLENPARLPQNALCTHLPVTLSTDGTKECIVLNAAGTILSVWLADTRTGCTAEDSKAERIAKINAALKSIAGNTGMPVSFAYAQQNVQELALSEDTKKALQSIILPSGKAAIYPQCKQLPPEEIEIKYRQDLQSFVRQILLNQTENNIQTQALLLQSELKGMGYND